MRRAISPSAGVTSRSAPWRAPPIRLTAPADGDRATDATIRTSSASGRVSIHFIGGYPVEPIDIHASVRHLDALFDMLTLSDKPVHAYSLGRERNLDAIEMVKIARGVDDETLEREPSLFTVINSSSPLRACPGTY